MKLLIIVLLLFASSSAKAFNEKLLPSEVIHCNNALDLNVRTIEHFFRDQHSLTVFDFSTDPTIATFVCRNGNGFIPIYEFDKFDKKAFEDQKVSNGGLSAYSITRGFMCKTSYNEMLKTYPLISELNPRSKLLINLENGSFAAARQLLEIGWKYKMLDVAVLMKFKVLDKQNNIDTNISLCVYNPFAGDKNERRPDFQCFNITKKDLPFDKIDKFCSERISNLHQYPLRIDIFEEVLTSRAVRNGNGMITHYEYADGDTIEQLAEVMNFTPIYIRPNDSSKYGYKLPNGTFTGSLGAIEYGKADLSAIPTFIADYDTKKSLFLQPIAMKRLFFIFQKRETFKVFIISIIEQLDYTSKVLAASLVFVFPLIHCLVSKLETKFKGGEKTSSSKNVLDVIALMTSNSGKISKYWATRFVVAAILFYTLLFSSLFQGSIIKSLNENQKGGDIKTVGELIKENYTLIVERSVVAIFGEQGGSELGAQLYKLSLDPSRIVDTSTRGFELALANKKVAFLLTDTSLPILKQFYNDKTGDDLFDFLPKAVFEFFVSPMSQKDSPFVSTLNFWLAKYNEVGIQEYQIGRALFDIEENTMIRRSKNGKVPQTLNKALTLRDLAAIFHLYWICIGISLVIFSLELLTDYVCKRHKRPKVMKPKEGGLRRHVKFQL